MSAVTSRSESQPAPVAVRGAAPIAVRGAAEVVFAVKGGATRLRHLYQHDPARVLFPAPPAGEPPTAVVANTAGGLVGGDVLELSPRVEEGGKALFTAQAAEKVYGSNGRDCRIAVRLEAGAGAWLEWLPQETIVFEGARLRRRTCLDVRDGGRILAGEILVFGRRAMGERLTRGLVREDREVRRDGRLVWAEALCLEDDIAATLAHPAGFDGAAACATAVYAGPDAPRWLDLARRLTEDGTAPDLRAGASLVNGVLVVRWLAGDALQLRRAFASFWVALRAAAAGLAPSLPTIWHV